MEIISQEFPVTESTIMNWMTEGCKTWFGWANSTSWMSYTVQSLTILITI